MNTIFGPVNSRRLGRSLGVDLLPPKICNLNCIYCEVGPTTRLTCQRAEYVPVAEILEEVGRFCRDRDALERVDVVTVTASGEPTLHSGFGAILQGIRARCGKPVAVLTNGTTLDDPEVRRELAQADIVIPSLDAALAESFRKIDRPAPCLELEKIIAGLISFSREYAGKLWLEILLVKGINDTPAEIDALLAVTRQMRLDRIQLNTVARPPLESWARPVEVEKLESVAARFRQALPGVRVDVLGQGGPGPDKRKSGAEQGGPLAGDTGPAAAPEVVEAIVHTLKRRPCTAEDIDRIFAIGSSEKVEQLLEPLLQTGTIAIRRYKDRTYYQVSRHRHPAFARSR